VVSAHAQLATNSSILSLTQTITALCKEQNQENCEPSTNVGIFFHLKNVIDSGFPFFFGGNMKTKADPSVRKKVHLNISSK